MAKSTMTRRERILEGNLLHSVCYLAWPIVLQSLLHVTMGMADLRMVNHLGHEAIAAVGIGRQVIMIILVMVLAIQAGAVAVVARKLGEKNYEHAESAAGQAMTLVLLFALVMTPVGILSSRLLLTLMGAKPGVMALGVPYMQVFFLGIVFFMGNFMCKAIFHGLGDTRTPLYINIAVNGINLIGNFFLIYGLWFFPELGVIGAAVASAFSRLVGTVLGIVVLNKGHYAIRIRLSHVLKFSFEEIKEILRIGMPTAFQGMSRNISTLLLVSMITRTAAGGFAAAAFPVGMKVNQFAIMPGIAIGQATTTMVGMNLGNENPKRAEQCGWTASRVGSILMSAIALINFIFAPQIMSFFAEESEVIEIGTAFIRIIAVAEPFHALGVILSKGMQGAGYTLVPFYLTVISWLGIRVPLAYLLAFPLNLQSTGVWISMNATFILQAVLVATAFKRGTWKEAKLKAYSTGS
ncbi:MATE family efflux transporter [Natranaerobius thermophilus]|uniref:Probable multidrug resistance protein NorM n=1 Tax=Natranaerobius thermophilus (strain ATCC BAA-1301 / DSM 18059 / JW/NM-WN-LF) TaxID=457570 RepID=B2A8M4_NATTJ|nr:MATE family efflux transporter [Natranaerobius thermophilus]ACB85908.1 MATE efflux family protein [Natranaerobius thermophilus JW/NM-WN-LF]